MGVLDGFHHVKVPVTDVARSREWYERVLGLALELEFVEDGMVMGVSLRDPGGTARLALRHDALRATALTGFDPVALGVATPGQLEQWKRRLDELDEPHGGVVIGHSGSVLVGLRDPDGIEIRLYTTDSDTDRSTR